MSGSSDLIPDDNQFSADKSILGFKYQLRYALYLLFEAQRANGFDVAIDIERIDDIDVLAQGKTTKLVQTKDTATVLTNSSAPLWKTVRIWSDAIRTGVVDLNEIQAFQLITTSAGPDDDKAIAVRLQSQDADTRQLALETMRQFARSKRNQASLGAAYGAFDDLTADQQNLLVSKIQIATSAPSFDELDEKIRGHIVQGPPGKQIPFSEVLFGRWDIVVENYLRQGKKASIAWNELQSILYEISQEFRDDNLPTEFVDMLRDMFPSLADDRRMFIRQLAAIGADDNQFKRAQRVYLKATQLLGFWQRSVLIRPDEVAAHSKRLVDECEIQHDAARTDAKLAGLPAAQIGQVIYNWALTVAPHHESLRIRPRCCDPDVIRGCFHDLADRTKIGWHPDWSTMFT